MRTVAFRPDVMRPLFFILRGRRRSGAGGPLKRGGEGLFHALGGKAIIDFQYGSSLSAFPHTRRKKHLSYRCHHEKGFPRVEKSVLRCTDGKSFFPRAEERRMPGRGALRITESGEGMRAGRPTSVCPDEGPVRGGVFSGPPCPGREGFRRKLPGTCARARFFLRSSAAAWVRARRAGRFFSSWLKRSPCGTGEQSAAILIPRGKSAEAPRAPLRQTSFPQGCFPERRRGRCCRRAGR